MKKTFTKIWSMTLSIAVMFAFLCFPTGCTPPTSVDPVTVCVVRGVHDLFPDVSLPNDMVCNYIEDVFSSGTDSRAVDIIVDGKPFKTGSRSPEDRRGGYSTDTVKRLVLDDTLAYLSFCSQFRGKTPESDLLGGLNLASHELKSAITEKKVLIIQDSGLSTCALLNFTKENLINTSPEKIVSQLVELHEIPDFNGVDIIWSGLGQVAGDQTRLTGQFRDKLFRIRDAIMNETGAKSITYDETQFVGEPPENVPPCTKIPMPEDELDIDKPLKLNKVRFQPDSDKLIDREEAIETLKPVAEIIKSSGKSVTILGTTATYGELDSCIDLSQRRATVVKKLLVSLGVKSEIRCLGIGYLESSLKVPDVDSKGNLIESAAKQNRAVYVYYSDSSIASEIRGIAKSYAP